MPTTIAAFGETVYEDSQQGRVMETSSAGENFELQDGHTVRHGLLPGYYSVTAKYSVSVENPITGARKLVRVNNAVYSGSNLRIYILKDENTTNSEDMDGSVYTVKNLDGQVILKRQFNRDGSAVDVLSTYYVYDDYNFPGGNPYHYAGTDVSK